MNASSKDGAFTAEIDHAVAPNEHMQKYVFIRTSYIVQFLTMNTYYMQKKCLKRTKISDLYDFKLHVELTISYTWISSTDHGNCESSHNEIYEKLKNSIIQPPAEPGGYSKIVLHFFNFSEQDISFIVSSINFIFILIAVYEFIQPHAKFESNLLTTS